MSSEIEGTLSDPIRTGYMLKNEEEEFWTGMEWQGGKQSIRYAARYATPTIAYAISRTFPEVDGEITVMGASLVHELFVVDPDEL